MNTFQFAFIQAIENAGEAGKEIAADVATKGAEAAKAAEAGSGGVALKLFFVLAVLILPFVLGQLIASALKMKADATRISTCLFAFMASLAPFVWYAFQGTEMNKVIHRGIDLAGGTNMVFQIGETEKDVTSQAMDQMVAAVSRRINLSGTEQVTVRQVGSDRIEIIVPGADPGAVADLKKKVVTLGSLEFGLLANTSDHAAIIAEARKVSSKEKFYRDATGVPVAAWRGLGQLQNGQFKEIGVGDGATREVPGAKDGEVETQFLVMQEPEARRITGQYLDRAYGTVDGSGRPAVGFVFDGKGSYLFGQLTRENRPRADGSNRRLAILLNDRVHSAPTIDEPIDGNGIIRGDFTQAEIRELTSVLNAGALELPLKPDPINEMTVSPLLGADVQEKGMWAIGIAAVAVVIFMLLYYRFAGIVAVMCLTLNLLLVLGCMVAIQATFTLPGIAGLVLTIGMAVDANVLIFERMREEQNKGASLRMCIQNGFGRAFTTIVDANVTTLITAVILFMIGTDQVKGFAVTLIIGILMSMFTALYFGRLIFDICERKRIIKSLSMTSVVGKTDWDFLGKRSVAAVVSFVFIAVGMTAFVSRGTDNYDIDFTGGTMVTLQTIEPHDIGEVRDALTAEGPENKPYFTPDITVEGLAVEGSGVKKDGNLFFRVRTRDRDETETEAGKELAMSGARIEDRVNAACTAAGIDLLRITMDYDTPALVQADETSEVVEPTVGGFTTVMEFEPEEVSVVTVLDNFTAALNRVAPDYKDKGVDSLIEVVGVAGTGMQDGENIVRKFSKVSVTTYPQIAEEDLKAALASMKDAMATEPHFEEVNSFASSVAGEMKTSALIAIIVSLIAIVGYIWFRFQRITFGLAAVAALVHDVLVVLGMVALCSYLSGNSIGSLLLLNDFKINLPMIAAFLTIVGYSLNDTIVVFDRIREVRGKNPLLTAEIVNTSLNQTLSRTLLTSVTTFIVVAILYAIGGEGIHGFAFCLVLGVIVGTYSSIFVASPVLLWLMNRKSGSTASVKEKPAKTKALA